MNKFRNKPHHPQQGFSLVEILLAMTLGLILLGGAITIYASSKNSYRLQENIAGMQENARFAILALRRELEMAGFPGFEGIDPFRIDAPNETRDGGGNSSDQITIRYAPKPSLTTDCLGTTIDPPNIIENHYFINEDNNLACRGKNDASQPLVENIDNMQILYGVDTDAESDGVANLYVTASELTAGIDTGTAAGSVNWERVVSVRVALLVASDTAINNPAVTDTSTDSASASTAPAPSGATGESFTLLDAPPITKDDGRLYRVFTATIPLRNRIL